MANLTAARCRWCWESIMLQALASLSRRLASGLVWRQHTSTAHTTLFGFSINLFPNRSVTLCTVQPPYATAAAVQGAKFAGRIAQPLHQHTEICGLQHTTIDWQCTSHQCNLITYIWCVSHVSTCCTKTVMLLKQMMLCKKQNLERKFCTSTQRKLAHCPKWQLQKAKLVADLNKSCK